MSKPEIARRCPICGASIREAAAFCPECGETLAQATPKGRRTESDDEKREPPEDAARPPQRTAAGQAAVGKVRDRIQRATTLARDVEGDVIHRVQKVRQISSVVLDEAGYDPSLRFVLVAAALFLLFLLVLLLNRLI
jgi:predicted amidophosphoribosyltransferase